MAIIAAALTDWHYSALRDRGVPCGVRPRCRLEPALRYLGLPSTLVR